MDHFDSIGILTIFRKNFIQLKKMFKIDFIAFIVHDHFLQMSRNIIYKFLYIFLNILIQLKLRQNIVIYL